LPGPPPAAGATSARRSLRPRESDQLLCNRGRAKSIPEHEGTVAVKSMRFARAGKGAWQAPDGEKNRRAARDPRPGFLEVQKRLCPWPPREPRTRELEPDRQGKCLSIPATLRPRDLRRGSHRAPWPFWRLKPRSWPDPTRLSSPLSSEGSGLACARSGSAPLLPCSQRKHHRAARPKPLVARARFRPLLP
jgi:hypothetical protein